jgi:RHS repeat-associated protein
VADRDWLYAYESSHRLDNVGWGTLNSGRTALTSTFATQDWGLDALGNWTSFDQVVGGMVDFNQTRTHNKANEVTGLTTTGNAWNTGIGHDAVGNITTMPRPSDPTLSPYTCVYDTWNRLVKVSEGSTTVAEYEYDGLNRRIVKSLGTGAVKDHYYFNEDWQELEVRKETSGTISANPLEQFVWHPYYIDALATRFYDSDVSNSTGVVQHYFTHDANFNVTSAVDTSGNVVERYDYSPYGEPIFLDANFDFDADSVSDIAHSRTYTGQRLDTETGLYQYRNRYYHARLGRFISRDPIGYEGSQWNLYEYVEGRPIVFTDPSGQDCPGCTLMGFNDVVTNPCLLACCAQHDECYFLNTCKASSWGWNVVGQGVGGYVGGAVGGSLGSAAGPIGTGLGGAAGAGAGHWLGAKCVGFLSSCADCNNKVEDCWAGCAVGGNHMQGKDLYFCPAKGKPIKIGQGPKDDFKNLGDAMKACCN